MAPSLIWICRIQCCVYFFRFRPEIPFLENLVQKIKIVSWRRNLVLTLIRICRIQWDVHFFRLLSEIPFLSKFGPKIQNFQFKAKLDTYTNSNMQNSMVMFTFFCFRPEILFLGKFGPKNQNGQFKVKLDTWTNSNMQNSMGMFTFFVFSWKYPFRANVVQNIKIISLSWNLVAILIWICKIQWCCSLFFVFDQKCTFWANLVQISLPV